MKRTSLKRAYGCVAMAAVMLLGLLSMSGGGAAAIEDRPRIFIHNLISPNEFVVWSDPITDEDAVYGVIRPAGTRAPAHGALPNDAVKMGRINTPFYVPPWGGNNLFFSAPFDLPGLRENGSYVLYVTGNAGAYWPPGHVTNFLMRNGQVAVMTHGSYGTGLRPEEFRDWDNIIHRVGTALEGRTISVDVFSGWMIHNTPMSITFVNEFSEEIVAVEDDLAVLRGDKSSARWYGGTFSAAFELPEAEGFYTAHFNFFGGSFRGCSAFWVREDGTVSVINLGGIGGSALAYDDFTVEPLAFPPGDNPYARSIPPVINLLPRSDIFVSCGTDTITAHSLDGGATWTDTRRRGNRVVTNDLIRHLRRNATAQLALRIERPPECGVLPEGADILHFPLLRAAPAAPRLVVNYQALYLTGSNLVPSLDRLSQQTFWALTEPNTDTIVRENIQIMSQNNGGDWTWAWFAMPETGVAVKPPQITSRERNGRVTYRARVQSARYQIRIGAVKNADGSWTLPSSAVTVRARGLAAPRAPRINLRNETVRMRRGTEFAIRGERRLSDGRTNVSLEGAEGAAWTFRDLPTRRRAGSTAATHAVMPRGEFNPGTTELQNGRLNMDRSLEFWNPANQRWARFRAPNGPQTGEILVRTRASGRVRPTIAFDSAQASLATLHDARLVGTEDQRVPEAQVFLASETYRLIYEWGEFTDPAGRTRTGIVSHRFERAG